MREIKFRAYDMDEKVMRKWEEIDFTKEIGEDYYMVGYKASEVCVRYDHEQILMQYTGLKDKNGKEIYEGDLLNMHYRNESVEKGKVVSVKMGMTYDSDGWEHERTYGWVAGNNSLADVAPYAEVLGNIYENPELLGEEE